ncbi:hypothetical protein RND61_28470 [Streptomyces sp. TRM76323]|uniref:Secreted protein n=1 Tax=Streptomyces tamarix TaxID=3078565 RepID=A0ABU3QTA0_9ACTN|nr:hypothetical protein [Streptomyces tamarix]MDT9685975.1 hypothetical protein [Streptomyces tamarix]
MRSSKPVRTAPPAVLALLVLPLAALALAVVHLLALAAPAQARAAGPYAGAETHRAHAPAAGQQALTGSRECEQSGASVNGATRGRDRHRAGAHALLLPVAAHPSSAADSPERHRWAGPGPLPHRERPRTAPTQADLQVFRC